MWDFFFFNPSFEERIWFLGRGVVVKIGLGLTNLEELSFLTVLAFPKASSRGLAWMI